MSQALGQNSSTGQFVSDFIMDNCRCCGKKKTDDLYQGLHYTDEEICENPSHGVPTLFVERVKIGQVSVSW